MRKTVIDGSNTSGFQRTILVGMDGFLETDNGKVGIPTICLEEDAARKIEEKGKTITYRLDRLGIPLVEICTDSEIKGPKHAREVAEKLGMILRLGIPLVEICTDSEIKGPKHAREVAEEGLKEALEQ